MKTTKKELSYYRLRLGNLPEDIIRTDWRRKIISTALCLANAYEDSIWQVQRPRSQIDRVASLFEACIFRNIFLSSKSR